MYFLCVLGSVEKGQGICGLMEKRRGMSLYLRELVLKSDQIMWDVLKYLIKSFSVHIILDILIIFPEFISVFLIWFRKSK